MWAQVCQIWGQYLNHRAVMSTLTQERQWPDQGWAREAFFPQRVLKGTSNMEVLPTSKLCQGGRGGRTKPYAGCAKYRGDAERSVRLDLQICGGFTKRVTAAPWYGFCWISTQSSQHPGERQRWVHGSSRNNIWFKKMDQLQGWTASYSSKEV